MQRAVTAAAAVLLVRQVLVPVAAALLVREVLVPVAAEPGRVGTGVPHSPAAGGAAGGRCGYQRACLEPLRVVMPTGTGRLRSPASPFPR